MDVLITRLIHVPNLMNDGNQIEVIETFAMTISSEGGGSWNMRTLC